MVHHVDATTNQVVKTIEVDDQYDSQVFYNIKVSGNRVWVATTGSNLLVEIDATTHTIIGRYQAGDNVAGGDVAVAGTTLWLVISAAAELTRIPLN